MTAGLSFANNVFSMGANGFSTDNRYPRQVANSSDTVMTMVEGDSTRINASPVPGGGGVNSINLAWRFECGTLTYTSGNGVTAPAVGFAIDRPIGV